MVGSVIVSAGIYALVVRFVVGAVGTGVREVELGTIRFAASS